MEKEMDKIEIDYTDDDSIHNDKSWIESIFSSN